MEYIHKIIDTNTDEITEIQYTDEELKDTENSIKFGKELFQKKNELRQSALAKLAALGLTEEEIAAL